MSWLRNVIGRPLQVHGVRTPEEYRAKVRAHQLRMKRSGYPVEVGIVVRLGHLPAYVSDGRWVADCDCGNGVSVDPERVLAICFECGSEWTPAIPPDWRAAERELLKRPSIFNRHWFPHVQAALQHGLTRTETVIDLARENREHGAGQ